MSSQSNTSPVSGAIARPLRRGGPVRDRDVLGVNRAGDGRGETDACLSGECRYINQFAVAERIRARVSVGDRAENAFSVSRR